MSFENQRIKGLLKIKERRLVFWHILKLTNSGKQTGVWEEASCLQVTSLFKKNGFSRCILYRPNAAIFQSENLVFGIILCSRQILKKKSTRQLSLPTTCLFERFGTLQRITLYVKDIVDVSCTVIIVFLDRSMDIYLLNC